MINYISLLIFTATLAVGQVLFKKAALAMQQQGVVDGLFLVFRRPTIYAALVLYGLATLLWVWILSRVPLAQAYPWVAGGVVLVPLLGWAVFGERLNIMFWVGAALVCCGIIVTQYALQNAP
jgi:multidrug transporter EmrE-like cation transporter